MWTKYLLKFCILTWKEQRLPLSVLSILLKLHYRLKPCHLKLLLQYTTAKRFRKHNKQMNKIKSTIF